MKKTLTSIRDTYQLANGVEIPCVAFGTWRVPGGEQCEQLVETAIECGYRHIDTAFAYENEHSVGNAVRNSGVKREEIFVTSKLPNSAHGYEKTREAFNKTMDSLKLDYLDLYLIHWPKPLAVRDNWEQLNSESWQFFEEMYEKGLIRSIGVSNFLEHHLEPLMKTAKITPMVNQLEMHPCCHQIPIHEFCDKNGIIVEAWAPFIAGKVFGLEFFQKLADKYNRSIAQICLRWSIQQGFLPLPKSSSRERMVENSEIFDFEISAEDMARMDQINYAMRSGSHPDTALF